MNLRLNGAHPSELHSATKVLKPVIERGKCIAWIGSGLSAGYPSWDDAVRKLCDACDVAPLAQLTQGERHTASTLLDKADECKSANLLKYHQALAELFGWINPQCGYPYTLLFHIPFLAFVTTNFDPMLKRMGELEGHSVHYRYPSLNSRTLGQNHAIFYLHGLALRTDTTTGSEVPSGEDLIFSTSEIKQAYEHGTLRAFVDQLFTFEQIVFIGCSLREPQMSMAFERVREIYSHIRRSYTSTPSFPEKYILLPSHYEEDVDFTVSDSNHTFTPKQIEGDKAQEKVQIQEEERIEDERFETMGIHPLRYDRRNNHAELQDILYQLSMNTGGIIASQEKVGVGEDLPT